MKVIILCVVKCSDLVCEITVTLSKCDSALIQFGICVIKYNFLNIDTVVYGYCNDM